ATFMVVLDTAIANVSLRYIAGSLAISVDESTWVVTTYLIATAVVLPISGWLSNVIGRKRFYMLCVAVFTFASLLCGLAGSLSALLLVRILQGIGGGGMAGAAAVPPPEGERRRRNSVQRAGDARGYVSSGGAAAGVRAVRHRRHRRAHG